MLCLESPSLTFPSPFTVGGVAKSQNSSQMNLSGSSSSLTSDASTKAGPRSYGIGGALLHKRILLMTRQHSRERSRERETEEEKGSEVENDKEEQTGAVQRHLFSSEQKRGRSRQQNNQAAGADSGLMLQRARADRTDIYGVHPTVLAGSTPSLPGLGPMTPSPLSQPQLMRPKPPESHIRTRLMSPFRILRERSQSRERPIAVRLHQNEEEVVPSSPQDEKQGQAEQRAKRSVSPNPFLWLCRDRHTRRKTV